MIFLDTSVLVAIAQVTHPNHRLSAELWNQCTARDTAVSCHVLAEVYSALIAMPPALRISPRDAIVALETFLKRATPVELSSAEYMETLQRAAALGLSGGIVYDALHLACARKVDAERIFTWNVKHFQMVAPDLAERIVTP